MRKVLVGLTPLLFVGSMFACSGADDGASGEAEANADSFGTCTPIATLGVRELGVCTATGYGGETHVLGGSVTLPVVGKIAVDVGHAAALPSAGGTTSSSQANISLGLGGVTGNTAVGTTVGASNKTTSDASVKNLFLSLVGLGVTATSIGTQSIATCGAQTATSAIEGLRINGVLVPVTGAINQTLTSGLVTIVINEQVKTATGITTNALHLSAAGALDLVVAQSSASVTCTCAALPLDAGLALPNLDAGLTIPLPLLDAAVVLPPIVLPPLLDAGITIPLPLLDAGITIPPIVLPPLLTDAGITLPLPVLDSGITLPTTPSLPDASLPSEPTTPEPPTNTAGLEVDASVAVTATTPAGKVGEKCSLGASTCGAGLSCAATVK